LQKTKQELLSSMNVKEKQKYEACFNYIGEAMTKAYESADKKRRSEISSYIKCLNNMYVYTNNLEIKLMINDTNKNSTFRRKRLQQERPFEKNGR
tara:strand:+ start:1467 stop:1751 length:285 start_codon:yes stop_codon:yes gene_type:complete